MDKRLLRFFYKWHRYEKQNNIDIIDFDLIQQDQKYPGSFNSREEVLRELITLTEDYNQQLNKNEFILAKLIASKYYLQALMGKKIPFNEYVINTMGVKPRLFSRAIIENQLNLTIQAYQKVGYQYSKLDIEKFNKVNQLSKNQIETTFKSFRNKILPKFINWIGIKIDLKYQTKFVDINTYWMNWISSNNKGEIILQYNLNKRHLWLRGSTEYLVFHEICAHAIQVLLWKKQISEGKMHPFLGLLTVFTPEQFLLEGIAEALYYFYPENPFSDYGLISMHTDHLYWLVMNNAHIMVNSGFNKEKIVHFVKEYLPARHEREILINLEGKLNHPLFRTYQYVYGITLYYHRLITNKLSQEQRRKYILDIYCNIFTPQTILDQYKIN